MDRIVLIPSSRRKVKRLCHDSLKKSESIELRIHVEANHRAKPLQIRPKAASASIYGERFSRRKMRRRGEKRHVTGFQTSRQRTLEARAFEIGTRTAASGPIARAAQGFRP
jgi:hypothetical protein